MQVAASNVCLSTSCFVVVFIIVLVLMYICWLAVWCQSSSSDGYQVQHQMAPTFVGDSIHETDGDKGSEAMTGGSLLGGPGMTEMPGLQAALAAASAAMQAAGQSMPPPAPHMLQPDQTISQARFYSTSEYSHSRGLLLPFVSASLMTITWGRLYIQSLQYLCSFTETAAPLAQCTGSLCPSQTPLSPQA